MIVQLGIPLIVLAFVLPIIAYFVVKKIRSNNRKKYMEEKFDKEGHYRMEIIEEGQEIKVLIPSSY